MSPATDKIIKLLKKSTLSLEDRVALVSSIMNKLMVLPLNDSIVISQNSIVINGKKLDVEQMISFKESCVALRDNVARKVLNEQVRYLATNMGVYKAVSTEELYFSKAALWSIAEENKLLEQII